LLNHLGYVDIKQGAVFDRKTFESNKERAIKSALIFTNRFC